MSDESTFPTSTPSYSAGERTGTIQATPEQVQPMQPVYAQPPTTGLPGAQPYSSNSNPSSGNGGDQSKVEAAQDAAKAVAGTAKEQASNVGQHAADAGQHLAEVAQNQAMNVVQETTNQARGLLDQARTEVGEQAVAQQRRLASSLRSLGEELEAMTQHSGQQGVATDLARQGAGKSKDVASWLEGRDPGQLVNEVQRFARQRPGTFLLAAAGAGLLAGRVTRGVKDGSDGNEGPQ